VKEEKSSRDKQRQMLFVKQQLCTREQSPYPGQAQLSHSHHGEER
jgi:hypothetical protein